MTGHAHEFPPPGVLPDPICPGIEVLVHRRATELVTKRPRRRIAALSSVGGVAVAALCTVLVLVIGAPSGSGLLSPRQAVAAVVDSLEGDGILHWVREGELVESPDDVDRPGTIVEQEWTDLATGNSHLVTTRTPSDGPPQTRTVWMTPDVDWVALSTGASEGPLVRQLPRRPGQPEALTAVDDVRSALERAAQGAAEIAPGGDEAGQSLVVVTERREGLVRRIWLTREEQPRVVRSETTVTGGNSPRPIVTTSTTKTWQILPRTPEALADVEVPTNAKRVP